MNEEITQDRLLSPISPDLQNELVDRYCSGLEGRLRSAPNAAEAQNIVDTICRNFDGACESTMIRSYLREYVNEKFTEVWKTR